MKKTLTVVAVGFFLAMTVSSAWAVEVFKAVTELRQYNPEKAYHGYTVWAAGGYAWLIDMEGNLVHRWQGGSYKLLENGNNYGQMFEMDWDGNKVWQWTVPSRPDGASMHHDNWKIFNPKLNKYTHITLVYYNATNAEIWAAGGDPSKDYTANNNNQRQDAIFEVDPDSGEIIWEWRFLDHTIQDVNAAWPKYVGAGKTIADYPGRNDIFWRTDQARSTGREAGMINDWHHCNSLNYNQDLGVIAVNAKHWSEFYVVDHDGTFVPGDPAASKALAAGAAGDFIYRFGNPSAYKQGDPPGFLDEGHQQMYGSHNIHWIPEGLPGGGHFLIFNNGCYNPRGFKSEIFEINPYLDANGTDTGGYVNPPDAGYDTNNNSKQIVWSFRSTQENSFYSNYISGCQRLPNGNTFINSGATGHFFEVTPSGEVVWEYIQPVTSRGARKFITDADGRSTFNTFRATRYGPDHPALVGRDLTPMGKITEFALGPFNDELNAFRNRK